MVAEREIARFPGRKSPERLNGSPPLFSALQPAPWGPGERRLMQVRPVSTTPRKSYHAIRRTLLAMLRWTFVIIGAATAATVLFSYLFHVNESIYDPSLFAIGIGGLFCLL